MLNSSQDYYFRKLGRGLSAAFLAKKLIFRYIQVLEPEILTNYLSTIPLSYVDIRPT